MIKAVLFDMDGVLVNSEKHYIDGTCFWIKRLGKKVSREEVSKIIGLTMDNTYAYLSNLLNEPYEKIVELNEKYFTEENPIVYSNYKFPDVIDTLKSLKEKGIKIVVCSMSDIPYVEKCIKELELDEYIDTYFGGEKSFKPKPNPEIFLKAAEFLSLNKQECVVVEDSYNGILAGKNSGILTCARKDKQFGIDQSHADIILESLTDVLKIIENV